MEKILELKQYKSEYDGTTVVADVVYNPQNELQGLQGNVINEAMGLQAAFAINSNGELNLSGIKPNTDSTVALDAIGKFYDEIKTL